jgi:type III secretory pathway component EscU
MIETAEILSLVTIIIAIGSFAVAFATFMSRQKDSAASARARDAEVMTELKYIGGDIKEIKIENRQAREELAEVRAIATHAQERADAAHKRLDRAHIDIVDERKEPQ